FEDAVHTAQVLAYSKAEQAEYFDSQKAYWDAYSVMTTALNEATEKGLRQGLQQGLQEGKELGKLEANLATAKKLLAKGFSIAEIAEMLELSEDDIKENL
ncbi:MAG: hypothetical protein EBX41_05630, partial [Chitinophagia bacterium]|nr:hypothetical protein [Chitinophagia bacterium]